MARASTRNINVITGHTSSMPAVLDCESIALK